jgi:hypothetical protein
VLGLKDALRVFFQAITQFGPAAVQSELRRLVQAKQGAA